MIYYLLHIFVSLHYIDAQQTIYLSREVIRMRQKKGDTKEDEHLVKIELNFTHDVIKPSDNVTISPFCAGFPPLDKILLEELSQDILISGVHTPVIVMRSIDNNYVMLDGQHRLNICRTLNVPCPAIVCEKQPDEVQARLAFSANLKRRGGMDSKWKRDQALLLREKFNWGYQKLAEAVGAKKSTVRSWINPKKKKEGVQICTPNDDGRNDNDQSNTDLNDDDKSDIKKVRDAIAQLDKIIIESVGQKFEEAGELFKTMRTILEEGQYADFTCISKDQVKNLLSCINGYHKKLSEWSNVLSLLLPCEPDEAGACLLNEDEDISTEANDAPIADSSTETEYGAA
jgi:hypothetical protein